MGSWLLGSKMPPRVEQANFALPLVRTNMILPHNLRRKPTLFCSRPTLIRDSTFPATWTKCPRPSNWQTWEEERPKGGEGNQCELRNGKWRAQGTNARAQGGTADLPPPPTEERALAPAPPHTRLNREARGLCKDTATLAVRELLSQLHFLRQWRGRNVDGRIRATGLPASTFCDGMSDNLGVPNDCG